MASDTPDPQNLKSWKEAFQYPIPTVRRVEQELRRDITSNKEKLRALVGARYRDLLGTAETIVEMNVGIQDVEGKLTDIGRRCNKNLIDKKSIHLNRLKHDAAGGDRRLGSANSTAEDIIESMAAFCLATSMSSADVIRHFHQVRLEVIGKQLGQSDSSGENISRALNLYIRTLQSTKILFSRRLSDALGKLTARPLLTDADIRNLNDLDIDVFERWVASDVKNFAPWIKLSDVSKSEAEKSIKNWSKQAFERFTKGCQESLKDRTDFADVISLRKKALDIWLAAAPATPTHSSLSVLEGIRNVFNEQLTAILQSQAKQLVSIGQEVASIISDWENQGHGRPQSLWSTSLTSMDYSSGAGSFKRAVMDTLLGQDEKISAVLKAYNSWLGTIQHSKNLIEELRQAKWEDFLEDEEGEDTIVDPVAILNEDDPHFLQQKQRSAVTQALMNLQSSFHSTAEAFGSSHQSDKAAFLLRLIRDLRREIPTDVLQDEDLDFASDVVPGLQDILATDVVTRVTPLKILQPSRTAARHLPGRTLWEGDPELPVQPLPSTFKFLRRLTETMEEFGPDLWSPSSVRVVKEKLNKIISDSFMTELEGLKDPSHTNEKVVNSELNSEAAEDGTDKKQSSNSDNTSSLDPRDWKIQLLFDAFYLRDALSIEISDAPNLNTVTEKLRDEIEKSNEIIEALRKAAHEYWKRTELLFGLLAA
ncbi:hypothetical protein T310_0559 [Rasamsonia emersonii CBS 393.64]|uniref:Conserved oligomeric Golgi complex subunit 1 n=1 Tax=Rasamsonia emersonii (strain ATCC 16479 / CBS 393.64 / IMI 116815) TaxID=1408163 RepID=A0A0F4Z5L0_RASE3|nr:hypothetical protein T310_0559 [Rasamsonia emersonii CBS 393.64]KKA25381.1 hypothetical protein T310_0559 [Rasamsonia emersonii CBS 393.64]